VGIVVVAGLFAGFVGGQLANSFSFHKPAEAGAPSARAAVVDEVPASAPLVRLRGLGGESCSVPPAQNNGAGDLAASPTVRADPLREKLDPAARRDLGHRDEAVRVAAHLQEPRDSRWASTMEATIRDGFAAMTGLNVQYSNLECRSVSCEAHLSWGNAQDALDEIRRVGRMHIPCAKFVDLDDPSDGKDGMTGTFVADCTEDKLGSSSESALK